LKQISLLSLLLLLIAGCSTKAPAPLTHKISTSCHYYSLASARCLDQEAYLDLITPYKVIFIGDQHDSVSAHKVMLETITGLQYRGFKVSVANEWFSPDENMLLKKYVKGELDANGSKALGWKKRVGYDFNLSEPIYQAVIDGGGTLYGINMSRDFKKKISEQNLSGMSADELSFYENLDLNVSAHKEMLAPFFGHCHMKRDGEDALQCTERMYRVQVAWDTMMGEESAKLAALMQEKEKLIVFVGAMHLEGKLGVNLRFARKSNIPSITLLPYPKDEEKIIEIEHGSSDLIYLYDSSSSK